MEETLCPTCGRDNSHLKQLALCGIAEENFHEYGICCACNKPANRSELTCSNCGELGPLNIKCECGFNVRLDLDECRNCRRYGYYYEQLARCGIDPKEFAEFVFCGTCRQPFKKFKRVCPNCRAENPNDNPSDKGTAIFNSFTPAPEGFIYILINPCMPEMVKIGKTTRTSEERAAELSNATGVPMKFIVAYEIEVSDCDAAESDTHNRLADFRVNDDREFFNVPLKTAIQIVEEMTRPYQL
jgi:hypothetical protein